MAIEYGPTLDEGLALLDPFIREGATKKVFHAQWNGLPAAIKIYRERDTVFNQPILQTVDAKREFADYQSFAQSILAAYTPEPYTLVHQEDNVTGLAVAWKEGGPLFDLKGRYYPARLEFERLRALLTRWPEPPFPSSEMWDPMNLSHDQHKGFWFSECLFDADIKFRKDYTQRISETFNKLIATYGG